MIKFKRARLGRVSPFRDHPDRRLMNLRGTEIHESAGPLPSFAIEVSQDVGGAKFHAGWPEFMVGGTWVPMQVLTPQLKGQRIASRYTAEGEWGMTRIRGPRGAVVEFRRGRWLSVDAFSEKMERRIGRFKVFATKGQYFEIESDVSEAEFRCIVVALASGIVFLTRPFAEMTRTLPWLHTWERPALSRRRSQLAEVDRVFGENAPLGAGGEG